MIVETTRLERSAARKSLASKSRISVGFEYKSPRNSKEQVKPGSKRCKAGVRRKRNGESER